MTKCCLMKLEMQSGNINDLLFFEMDETETNV